MKEQLIAFLESRSHHNEFSKDLAHNLIVGTYGGSYLHGTNEKNSDFDLRAVAVLNEDYILGLREFEHTKLNGGTNGITTAEDLDVEVFHYDSFIRRVIAGEVNTIEMLYAPKDKIFFMEALFRLLHDHRHLFFSKNLLRHYKGLVYRHVQQAQAKVERLKKPEKIERILKYSYDTKEIMKAVMYLLIQIEFLKTGELNLFRHDAKMLLELKHGGIATIQEALAYVDQLIKERDAAFETSKVPDKPPIDRI